MKTLRVVNEKHYQREEIKLSPTDIQIAIKEYLENRFAKFQTGWDISVDYTEETKVVCSKWAGFTCPKCKSSMTVTQYSSDNCRRLVCEETEGLGKCCCCVN